MLGKMSLILSVLLFTTTLSDAQVLLPGNCPEIISHASAFIADKFSGTWYEVLRTKRWVGTEIECVTHMLVMNTHHNISYDTHSYSPSLDKKFEESGDADVIISKIRGSNKDAVMFDVEEYGIMNELVLLDTDYTSFAVLWSCASADEDLHFENTMIWTRDEVPKSAALSKGLRALDNNNLARNYLTYTRHRNCPDFQQEPDQGLGREPILNMGSTSMDTSNTTTNMPMTMKSDMMVKIESVLSNSSSSAKQAINNVTQKISDAVHH